MTSSATGDSSRDTHWRNESLSLHDLESVGGESARPGLVRTLPREEKKPRPRRSCIVPAVEGEGEVEGGGNAGRVQGVASSWDDIVSSMLPSPQGASDE